jgi:hypothetical protein
MLQLLALGLGLWALAVAWPRIATLHLGSKRIFRRARHVFLGELCLGGVILGAAGGAIVAHQVRGTWLASGAHAWGGLALAAFALLGLASGLYLALARPRPRKLLPFLHGLNNLLLLVLAFWQIQTGQEVMALLKALP